MKDVRRTRILVVPILGAAALVAVVALVGARGDRATPLERVATNPMRFLGEDVRVTGRVVASAIDTDLFVLEGPERQRLLLTTPDGVHLAVGVRVAVRGRVELLVSGVAARFGTTTVVRAREIVARPG